MNIFSLIFIDDKVYIHVHWLNILNMNMVVTLL